MADFHNKIDSTLGKTGGGNHKNAAIRSNRYSPHYITGLGDGNVNQRIRNVPPREKYFHEDDLQYGSSQQFLRAQQQQQHQQNRGPSRNSLSWSARLFGKTFFRGGSSNRHPEQQQPYFGGDDFYNYNPGQGAAEAAAAPWQLSAFALLGAVVLLSALFLHVLADSTEHQQSHRRQRRQNSSLNRLQKSKNSTSTMMLGSGSSSMNHRKEKTEDREDGNNNNNRMMMRSDDDFAGVGSHSWTSYYNNLNYNNMDGFSEPNWSDPSQGGGIGCTPVGGDASDHQPLYYPYQPAPRLQRRTNVAAAAPTANTNTAATAVSAASTATSGAASNTAHQASSAYHQHRIYNLNPTTIPQPVVAASVVPSSTTNKVAMIRSIAPQSRGTTIATSPHSRIASRPNKQHSSPPPPEIKTPPPPHLTYKTTSTTSATTAMATFSNHANKQQQLHPLHSTPTLNATILSGTASSFGSLHEVFDIPPPPPSATPSEASSSLHQVAMGCSEEDEEDCSESCSSFADFTEDTPRRFNGRKTVAVKPGVLSSPTHSSLQPEMPFLPALRNTAVQEQQQQKSFFDHIGSPTPEPLDNLDHLIETGSVTWYQGPTPVLNSPTIVTQEKNTVDAQMEQALSPSIHDVIQFNEQDISSHDGFVSDGRPKVDHVRINLVEDSNAAASLQGAIEFNELQLVEVIGGGGFGQVWRAVWRSTPVAVKVLSGSAQSQKVPRPVLEEFAAEINLLKGMRHPNICLYMGACLQPPNRAIVTELAANGSLWDALRLPLKPPFKVVGRDGISDEEAWPAMLYQPDPRHGVPPASVHSPSVLQAPNASRSSLLIPTGSWPWALVKRVACGTARGMAYLHSGLPPVLHRDLKSANILLDESYVPKVCDFGLSRLQAAAGSMTGNCGTVQWMAPEVLANHKYNEKADVFSYGIILWELLTRTCPYEGMGAVQCALAVLNRAHRPSIPTWCPPFLHALIRSCLKTNPRERPTFAQILVALESMEQ